MSSFYGNIKNNSRASFIFDKIYTSRFEMEKALKENTDENGQVQGDGIFINRYVLINYGYTKDGTFVKIPSDLVQGSDEESFNIKYIVTNNNFTDYYYLANAATQSYLKADVNHHWTRLQLNNNYNYYKKVNFVDRWINGTNEENSYYADNRAKDAQVYQADYDLTVWMKIYSGNEEKYIMVARLGLDAPALELITDAPGESPHFDLLQSSNTKYVYHVPNNWQFSVNQYDPEKEENGDYDIEESPNDYWNYEINIDGTRSYNSNIKYPYFNQAGFDPVIKTRVDDITDEIIIRDTKSGKLYLDHDYKGIDLTPDTYRRNQYYYKKDDEYFISTGEFVPNEQYYIKTQARSSDYEIVDLTPQTYRRNYYYINDGNSYILTDMAFDPNTTYYTNIAESVHTDTKRLDISLPSIGNAMSDVYDVLYGKVNNGETRPYNLEDLFNYRNISPYNNIDSSDQISMGWAMEEFKNYISELRFLSHGSANISDPPHPGIGLQSDWLLDDSLSFGYIYNKPRIIWQDDPITGHTGLEYLKRSIEFIYDNYRDLDENSLFGDLIYKCTAVTINDNIRTIKYLTSEEENALSTHNSQYPKVVPVYINEEIIGYSTIDSTYYTSNEELSQYQLIKTNSSNYINKFISNNELNKITLQPTPEYPNIISVYNLNNNLIGYTNIMDTIYYKDVEELTDYIIVNQLNTFEWKYLTLSQLEQIENQNNYNIYPYVQKVEDEEENIIGYSSLEQIENYISDSNNLTQVMILYTQDNFFNRYITSNFREDFLGSDLEWPYIYTVFNPERDDIQGYISQEQLNTLPSEQDLIEGLAIYNSGTNYTRYIDNASLLDAENYLQRNFYPNVLEIYRYEDEEISSTIAGYLNINILNELPEEGNLTKYVIVDTDYTDLTRKYITANEKATIDERDNRRQQSDNNFCYVPIYEDDGSTLIGYATKAEAENFPSAENGDLATAFVISYDSTSLVSKWVDLNTLETIENNYSQTWENYIPIYNDTGNSIIGYDNNNNQNDYYDDMDSLNGRVYEVKVLSGEINNITVYLNSTEETTIRNNNERTQQPVFILEPNNDRTLLGFVDINDIATLKNKEFIKLAATSEREIYTTPQIIRSEIQAQILDPDEETGYPIYTINTRNNSYSFACIVDNNTLKSYDTKIYIKDVVQEIYKDYPENIGTNLSSTASSINYISIFNNNTQQFIGYASSDRIEEYYKEQISIQDTQLLNGYLTDDEINSLTSESALNPYPVFNIDNHTIIDYTGEEAINNYSIKKVKIYDVDIINRKLDSNQINNLSLENETNYLIYDNSNNLAGFIDHNILDDYYNNEVRARELLVFNKYLNDNQLADLSDDSILPIIVLIDNENIKYTSEEQANEYYNSKVEIPEANSQIYYLDETQKNNLSYNPTAINTIPIYSKNNNLFGYASEDDISNYLTELP